ncbi:hypothetical protein ACN20G_15655 [Streptomyces sp. BI20]|uniref:F0F1 ATP synthase subunit B family protein n=1 Tax=Streptomyces sp. BI20 TaxID=3403460 RepID=UPI003C70A118
MGPLKPNLIELVVGLIAFAGVFLFLARVLLPRIERTLKDREAATTGALEQVEGLRLRAEDVLAAYRAELGAARHEAARIRQAAQEEGAALLAEVRAEGRRVREEMVAEAAVRLAADRVIAEAELREDVVGLATELAGRIIGEPLTDLDRARAVADGFFAETDANAGD